LTDAGDTVDEITTTAFPVASELVADVADFTTTCRPIVSKRLRSRLSALLSVVLLATNSAVPESSAASLWLNVSPAS
jgi:hypothetical protein